MEIIFCHLLPPRNLALQQVFILPEQSSPMEGPCCSRGFGVRLVGGFGALLSSSATRRNCELRHITFIKYTDTANVYLHTKPSEMMPLLYLIAPGTKVPRFWKQQPPCLRNNKYSRNNFCSSQMNPRNVLLNNTHGFYRNN
jgi:hypothetical protein